MNPFPSNHILPDVHLGTPYLSDREIAVLANQAWTCAACGHREHSTDPDLLRELAQAHAREHAENHNE